MTAQRSPKRTAVVAGASGRIGRELLTRLLREPVYDSVIALTRRRLNAGDRIVEVPAHFDRLGRLLAPVVPADATVDAYCCLGTTLRTAGSEAAFRQVDFDYVVAFGRSAAQHPVRRLVVVTALGADPESRVFYNRVKGQVDIALRALGIGRYTLGAIASIAFGMRVPALGGNIKRVYARVFDISEPVDTPKGDKGLWELAEKYLPKHDAGDYNQALMDLGATICIPKNPRCLICPFMELCEARQRGTQNLRPVKSPKKSGPHHIHAAGVIVWRMGREASPGRDNPADESVLLAKRPSDGLLGGMWEFPNGRVEGDPLEWLPQALKTGYGLLLHSRRRRARGQEPLAVVHHGYTHFTVSVYVYRCELATEPVGENLKWVRISDLDEYPMGRIDRQIADLLKNRHLFNEHGR